MNVITRVGRGWQFSFILLLLLSGTIYLAKTKPPLLPIKVVKITGSYQYVQQDELMYTILPYVSTSILLMSVNDLNKHIRQMPWVADAVAYRVWPATIAIHFSEQKPFALWGDHQIMNAHGEIFTPSKQTMPKNLPQLNGLANQQKQILQEYQKMTGMLQNIGLTIEKMDMRDTHAYKLTLSNGTKLLMSQKESDAELKRYIKSYNEIFSSKNRNLVSVDLRYSSGIAVKLQK